MRSLKYAEGVLTGERKAPENVVKVAKEFKQQMDAHNRGDNIGDCKRQLIENLIEYDEVYMTNEREHCDAVVFATIVSILYDDVLFVIPRKNGKTRTLIHIIRFIHLYYNELTVGIFASDIALAKIVASEMVTNLHSDGFFCVRKGNEIRIDGKNNKYVLLSDNNPAGAGSKKVDILLIDEFLALPNVNFNSVDYNQVKAVSSIYIGEKSLTLDDIIDFNIFDKQILYTTPAKKYNNVTVEDMVISNPVFENELYYKRSCGSFGDWLKKHYERNKYFTAHQPFFLIQHLNMTDIEAKG